MRPEFSCFTPGYQISPHQSQVSITCLKYGNNIVVLISIHYEPIMVLMKQRYVNISQKHGIHLALAFPKYDYKY